MVKTAAKTVEGDQSSGSTREKLLLAARDLFNSAGYYGTDTNRIARAAGYAPATFYKHFEDKTAIFIEVYREWVIAEWAALEKAGAASGDARSLTREWLGLVRDHHCRWAGFRRSLRALVGTDAAVNAARLEQRKLQLSKLQGLRAAQHLPSVTDARLLFILYAVERVCDAIADAETDAIGVNADDLFEELVSWLARGDSSGARNG